MSAGLQSNKIPTNYMLRCMASVVLVKCPGPENSRHQSSKQVFNQVILLMSSMTAGLTLKVQYVKIVSGF
jgi:hypothetical protein